MSYNSDIEQPKTSERLGIQSSACSESTCGFKKTPWGELYRWLIDVRAKFRAWCGFCPACNSDAPEIDRCWLCRGYRWDRDGVPNKQTKRLWMHRWENGPGTSPNDIIPNTSMSGPEPICAPSKDANPKGSLDALGRMTGGPKQ